MEHSAIYFLGILAYTLAVSLVVFGTIIYSRRHDRSVTTLRGLAVLLIGWVVASLLNFVTHLLFALAGIQVEGGPDRKSVV